MVIYGYLKTEYQKMWNKKVGVVLVTIGATGMVEKKLNKYFSRIPGQHINHNLQRSAILSTAHILRKVLSIKPD